MILVRLMHIHKNSNHALTIVCQIKAIGADPHGVPPLYLNFLKLNTIKEYLGFLGI